jgi:hypothetical protein
MIFVVTFIAIFTAVIISIVFYKVIQLEQSIKQINQRKTTEITKTITHTNPPTITMTFADPVLHNKQKEQKKQRTHHADYNTLCEQIILDKHLNKTPNHKIFKKFGTSLKAWKKHATQDQKDRFYNKIPTTSIPNEIQVTVEQPNPFLEKINNALKYKEDTLCPDDKMYKKFDFSRLMFSRHSTQEQKDKLLELQKLTREQAKKNFKKSFDKYGAMRKV